VHDRAWPRRPIFGKVRFMNEKGCRRKFAVDDYIAAVG
jgi:deoxyribodipyrimidine photo-lyase